MPVLVHKDHKAFVIGCDRHEDGEFPLVEFELDGQKVAQCAGLGILEVVGLGLIGLLLVREEDQLASVRALGAAADFVSLFEAVIAPHAQGQGGDFFEIPLFCQKKVDGIILDQLFLLGLLDLGMVNDHGFPIDAVFLGDPFQLGNDDLHKLLLRFEDPGHFRDFGL
ncbi:hypothetical protein SDC9_116447 [bioreactor metagenome]|uniref:Uncharacterized protein n=1 Tax=bioreactor metagenome TaxID=1076179 RepID=A0A645BW48_9ZZZZ